MKSRVSPSPFVITRFFFGTGYRTFIPVGRDVDPRCVDDTKNSFCSVTIEIVNVIFQSTFVNNISTREGNIYIIYIIIRMNLQNND